MSLRAGMRGAICAASLENRPIAAPACHSVQEHRRVLRVLLRQPCLRDHRNDGSFPGPNVEDAEAITIGASQIAVHSCTMMGRNPLAKRNLFCFCSRLWGRDGPSKPGPSAAVLSTRALRDSETDDRAAVGGDRPLSRVRTGVTRRSSHHRHRPRSRLQPLEPQHALSPARLSGRGRVPRQGARHGHLRATRDAERAGQRVTSASHNG